MNRAGKIAVCLAGGLALNAGLRADDIVLPGNPYAPVVARNVFDLNPIVTPDNTQASEPPAKITPNGIMSIFGHLQVLFKVSGATKDGRPVGDESYILAEGQRQDDIEVTHIDQKASIVTFDNHGVVQIIPLANAVAELNAHAGINAVSKFYISRKHARRQRQWRASAIAAEVLADATATTQMAMMTAKICKPPRRHASINPDKDSRCHLKKMLLQF